MSDKNYHITVVMSEFNKIVTDGLLKGAKKAFSKNNGKKLTVIKVPGAFEIPATTKKVASQLNPDAIVTLGAIIKGETKHFDFICNAVALGIKNLNIALDVPVIFGVLTDDTMLQAENRSGGKHGNKGVEAAITAIKMAVLNQ